MECNKDEADRSKAIAEAKFLQHDFVGARKFALKAQQLFPELEGLPQFISALEVHTIAQERLPGGERDWYGILQTDPTADENTIRKQYRKLALLLHPDKNKSVGAEAAFKHLSEAWRVLSDKNRKAAYDTRRHSKASQSSQVAQFKEPWTSSHKYHNIGRPTATNEAQPHQSAPDFRTFWTACPSCKMQFEYQCIYENKNLCCSICYKPFLARQVGAVTGTTLWPPHEKHSFRMGAGAPYHHVNGFVNGIKSSTWSPHKNVAPGQQMKERARKASAESQEGKDVTKKEQKKKGQKKKEKDEHKAKAAAQAKEVLDRLVAKSKGVIEQKLSSEKAGVTEQKLSSEKAGVTEQKLSEKADPSEHKVAADITAVKVSSSSNGSCEGVKQEREDAEKMDTHNERISNLATRKSPRSKRISPANGLQDDASPAKKSRSDLQASPDEQSMKGKKCDELNISKIEKLKKVKKNGGNGLMQMEISKPLKESAEDATDKAPKAQRKSPAPSTGEIDLNSMPVADDPVTVPDAEFYDFDKDRSEHCFSAGQIWAAYDDDAMPRFYARISKVFSCQPFKVQIEWLEARYPSQDTKKWLDSGLPYTCGEYRLGSTTISECINTFSHLVTFEAVQRRGFKIYPRKGDVWALYRDWNTLKVKDAKQGYDMIQVLADFEDKLGIQVCFLVKIEGFKTLFQRQSGAQSVQWISPKDLRRFSHKVPAHPLMAEQAPGLQEGCMELDPASTPIDLLNGKLQS